MKYLYKSLLKKVIIAILLLVTFKASAVTQTVNIGNFFFSPSSFTINLGDTVKWVLTSGVHTTTSSTVPSGAATWNMMLSTIGASFKYVPTKTGVYNYFCTIHGATVMSGTFTVQCPTPSVSISAGSTTTFCTGGSVTLSLSSGSFTSYQWKKDGSDISGATNSSFSATQSGSYTLRATNSCNNSGTSNAIVVTVNTAPTSPQAAITAGGPTTFCSGSSVVLTVATAGLSYKWRLNGNAIAGATNQSFSATQTGAHTCDVSNSCGSITSNSISVTVNNCITTLNLKFFLQGYYVGGGMMQQVLYNEGIDPNPSSTNVDSVLIELHNAVNTGNVVASYKGIVRTDGNITCTFPGGVTGQSCYIVVKYRNALETWSASPHLFTASSSYNFASGISQAYPDINNSNPQMYEVEPGVWAIYNGDVNQDQSIDGSDFNNTEPDVTQAAFGYYVTDITGDGPVDGGDFNLLELNVGLGLFVAHP